MKRQTLSDADRKRCFEDAVYRLNCLMAHDLYEYIGNKYKNDASIYKKGHILAPAFEASIIFGRQLLEFLQIKLDGKTNTLYKSDGRGDDITIGLYRPDIKVFPLDDPITKKNEVHIRRLIKIGNKAIGHFTRNHTTGEEFQSLKIARFVIYDLMLKYLPEINDCNIYWENRDNYLDAVQVEQKQ